MKARWLLAISFLLAPVGFPESSFAKAKEKILYHFTGGVDGGSPSSSLIFDSSGNLYGTTAFGGNINQCGGYGCGVVFKLTPNGYGGWQESVLYAFQGGSDGSFPAGNLVFDASGNIYGTTSYGGTGTICNQGCGTVFELSSNSDGTWAKTVLYDFQGDPNGAGPVGLTFGASGSLFGITPLGGAHNNGVVYELSHTGRKGAGWSEQVLYEFSSQDGTLNSGLILDDRGNLYGTYYVIDVQFCSFGCGAVFELQRGNRQWSEVELYDFLGGGNGGQPAAGVIRDNKGNLYGTAAEGGNNFGMAFELSRSGRKWKETMVHNFCSWNNCADGSFPLAGLVMDKNGALYGTTEWGGTGCSLCGVVFKLTRTKNGWQETVLHDFRGGKSDGVGGNESLILDRQGNLYGASGSVVYEIMP